MLAARAKELREEHWRIQQQRGIKHVPSNDFSLYDQVLDAIQLVGAAPPRYCALGADPGRAYFAMARGLQSGGVDVPAMEMTKWFDTNYHYIVPRAPAGHVVRAER